MSAKTDWQDAFPAVEYPETSITPEQELVVVNVERELGRKPFVTLDPTDPSDGTADEFPVLVWTMPEPWTAQLGPDDDETETAAVFAVAADGTCHIGGNIGAASWKGLRDALASL